jgi:hypothetical protein
MGRVLQNGPEGFEVIDEYGTAISVARTESLDNMVE